MGQVERIVRRPGKNDVGKGEDDVVLAIAAAYGRAVTIVGTKVMESAFLFMDGIKLAHIKRILDSSLSNPGRLRTEVHAQPFDLVHSLIVFEKWAWSGGQNREIVSDITNRIFGKTVKPTIKGHVAPIVHRGRG